MSSCDGSGDYTHFARNSQNDDGDRFRGAKRSPPREAKLAGGSNAHCHTRLARQCRSAPPHQRHLQQGQARNALARNARRLHERGIDVPDTLLAHVLRRAGSISASPATICGARSTSPASGSGRSGRREQPSTLSVRSEKHSAMTLKSRGSSICRRAAPVVRTKARSGLRWSGGSGGVRF